MKIRLIQPAGFDQRLQLNSEPKFSIFSMAPPVTMPLLAALTPQEVEVGVTDEELEIIDFEEDVDLVGVTAITPHAPRAYEIAQKFRKRGVSVIMGGLHASLLPHEAIKHVDSVLIGEAENIWESIIDDFKRSSLKPFYHGTPAEMESMPRPRLDLLRRQGFIIPHATIATRGCPFLCDFCVIKKVYGQGFRKRSVKEVISEIAQAKSKIIFFWDDNIAGDAHYLKELMRRLIPLKVYWGSQATVKFAEDDELLKLAQKSGCGVIFMGFESISGESLKHVKKSFNNLVDYGELVKKMHDHGIHVAAGAVFGFEHDDKSIFERTVEYLIKINVDSVAFKILIPYPGTQTFEHFQKENRLIYNDFPRDWGRWSGDEVVFKPRLMSPEELFEGYLWAVKNFYSTRSIFKRTLCGSQKNLRKRTLYKMFGNLLVNFDYKNKFLGELLKKAGKASRVN